ncbi:MAG: CDP-diacylglycerol--glycerol-3-phosphate 3-phosphatidyltransferase [Spirochaetia bacterium]|nr:CDP-diacylglycerol--glycerol-3-phosphate 3-phosphatidyltransferase [Spirochaetia bacterium]
MNIPNKLTVSRLFLAPIFFVLYFLPNWTGMNAPALTWLLLLVYVLIEISDLLDGFIARRYQMVTDLGKVLDPFSDVISRMTYFVCLAFSGIMPLWVFLIILYRELSVTFLRMILMGKGVAMAASIWGKSKAVLYAVSAILGILYTVLLRLTEDASWLGLYASVLWWVFVLAAAASIGSFLSYLNGAKTHLADMSS